MCLRVKPRPKIILLLAVCGLVGLGINICLLIIQEQEVYKSVKSPSYTTESLGGTLSSRLPLFNENIKSVSELLLSSNSSLDRTIIEKILQLDLLNKKVHSQLKYVVIELMKNAVFPTSKTQINWRLASKWISARHIHPEHFSELGIFLKHMATAPIIQAGIPKGGTQLKLKLILEGQQRVIFKPKRYSRNHIIEGTPYAGADRHNGEIAAYHLNRLLNFRRTPLVVGRSVNLIKEILPVAEPKLKATFFNKDNQTCFYGVCYYCQPSEAACGDPGTSSLEGAMILWLPNSMKLKPHRHPWSRTYRDGILAPWETNNNYCYLVRKNPSFRSGPRLLDFIDTAIFDFLIGNADRHRYEVIENFNHSSLLLLDNGKSFGNPFHDELSILSPLYQCCIVRESTFQQLLLFSGITLGSSLKKLLSQDPLAPILTDAHIMAVDRRWLKVIAVIEICFEKKSREKVLINDGW